MLTDMMAKEELHSLLEGGIGDAFVSALLTFGGELGRDEKGYYLLVTTQDDLDRVRVAVFHVLREGEVGMIQPPDKRRNKIYSVEVRGRRALELLSDLGKVKLLNGAVVSMDNGVKSRISSHKDAAEYVIAAYLSVGSISRAGKGVRVTFSFEIEDYADAFAALLLHYGIALNKSEKAGKYFLSTRSAQIISDLFALVGASKCALAMQDKIITSEAKNNIRRAELLNAANLDKAMIAAVKQYNDVKYLQSRKRLTLLPPELRVVAEARLKNPDLSLEALRQSLPENISKSGLYHRFEKIAEIVRRMKEEEK